MGVPLPCFWQEQNTASIQGRKCVCEGVQVAGMQQGGHHTAYQHALMT